MNQTSSWGTRRTSSTPTFLKQTHEHQWTKKNTRSPSFQPCSSNKNPGPIVQFQPVPTEGAQFHLPRTHGLQFRELQFLQRCSMDGFFAAVVFRVTNGNLEIFGSGKSPGSQGFNRNVEGFILVDTTCLLYESYLGFLVGVCSSFVNHRSEIGG